MFSEVGGARSVSRAVGGAGKWSSEERERLIDNKPVFYNEGERSSRV